jgi:hypothetical protein
MLSLFRNVNQSYYYGLIKQLRSEPSGYRAVYWEVVGLQFRLEGFKFMIQNALQHAYISIDAVNIQDFTELPTINAKKLTVVLSVTTSTVENLL